jgi:tetratricopeptide (TPR) repeat protein
MDEGIKFLNHVLNEDPENTTALKHLFDIYKTQSENRQFHNVTKRLLILLSKDDSKHHMTVEVYNEYIKHAQQPKLSADLYLRLISILSIRGYPEKAERILAMFLNKKPDFPGLSTVLLKLANGYKIKGNYKKQRKCLNILCSKYSNSPEAQLANTALSRLP